MKNTHSDLSIVMHAVDKKQGKYGWQVKVAQYSEKEIRMASDKATT